MTLDQFAMLPDHLQQLQALVNRCPDDVCRKTLIVAAGTCEAISAEEAHLLITANQVEEA